MNRYNCKYPIERNTRTKYPGKPTSKIKIHVNLGREIELARCGS